MGERIKVRRVDFYPDDWIAGTVGLTHLERSVYISIIAAIWAMGGPAPLDYLRRICPGRGFQQGLDGLLRRGKVTVAVGFVSQSRAITELSRSHSRINQAHENGAKGGRPNGLAKPDGSANQKANSHTVNNKDSVANATDAPIDPVRDLWYRGKMVLNEGGVPEKQTGSLLGKWRKDFGDPAVTLAIGAAERELPANIVEFMVGCMRHARSEMNGHGHQNKSARWLRDSLEAVVEADGIEDRARRTGAHAGKPGRDPPRTRAASGFELKQPAARVAAGPADLR